MWKKEKDAQFVTMYYIKERLDMFVKIGDV